uniref:8 kDa Amblyomma family member n=1 Tax=Rhipicephalus zambeziensis TaxID=60191 RepID=A0A224Y138_9ACAR
MRASKILLFVVLTVAAIMLNSCTYGVRHLAYCKKECFKGTEDTDCPGGCHCVFRDDKRSTKNGTCWKLPKSEIPKKRRKKT